MRHEHLRMANNVLLPKDRGDSLASYQIPLFDYKTVALSQKATEAVVSVFLSIATGFDLRPSSTNHALAWELIAPDLIAIVIYYHLNRNEESW